MKWSLGSCGVCRMKSVGVCGGGGGGGGCKKWRSLVESEG